MTGAVDTWARDMASEAKELAVQVNAKHDAHEDKCHERNANRMAWEGITSKKIDDLRSDLWKMTLGGIVTILAAFAIVTWALIQKMAGLS